MEIPWKCCLVVMHQQMMSLYNQRIQSLQQKHRVEAKEEHTGGIECVTARRSHHYWRRPRFVAIKKRGQRQRKRTQGSEIIKNAPQLPESSGLTGVHQIFNLGIEIIYLVNVGVICHTWKPVGTSALSGPNAKEKQVKNDLHCVCML